MERDRRRSSQSEKERERRGRRITALVHKVAEKRGEPFTHNRIDEHPFAIPRTSISGYRFMSLVLTASSWIETTVSNGIGSDDIANFSSQVKVFEVREHGKVVFGARALIQGDNDGGPLSLTAPDPKSWGWHLFTYRPGPWEKNLRRLARDPRKKARAV